MNFRLPPFRWAAGFACALMAGPLLAQAPEKTVVKGTFLGDGKEANIPYLVVQTREPFSDKPAIRLVFTEKNPASSRKPDVDAAFKKLGSALILSVFQDGQIFGCEVAHTAHSKSPFSAVGKIRITDFKATESAVSGHVTTGGTLDAFGQKWDVDLTFSAPLPKGAFAATPGSKPAGETPEKASAPAGPQLPVSQLPLPAGAKDVDYKKAVEHITFRSDSSVSAVAGEFSQKLKQQGWKEKSGSLMTPVNAILRRERHGAEMTVMVQPASPGCTVKIFTKGLDWSETPASSPATAAPTTAPADLPSEATRLINDALKQVPGR